MKLLHTCFFLKLFLTKDLFHAITFPLDQEWGEMVQQSVKDGCKHVIPENIPPCWFRKIWPL
jgi:hypothetical protein